MGSYKKQNSGAMGRFLKSLWLQEKVVLRGLDYAEIKREENPSDGLTKHVRQELVARYATMVGLTLGKDRAKKSLQLSGQ